MNRRRNHELDPNGSFLSGCVSIGSSGDGWSLLGRNGVPNRVDEWGEDYRHDWVTWREMLPKYLAESLD